MPGSSTNSLLRVPPTLSVCPPITRVCDEWSADTSEILTATNGATLAVRGLTPDRDPVNVSSVRAGSVPPGLVEVVAGGVVGVGVVEGDVVVGAGVGGVCGGGGGGGGVVGGGGGGGGGRAGCSAARPPPAAPPAATRHQARGRRERRARS